MPPITNTAEFYAAESGNADFEKTAVDLMLLSRVIYRRSSISDSLQSKMPGMPPLGTYLSLDLEIFYCVEKPEDFSRNIFRF